MRQRNSLKKVKTLNVPLDQFLQDKFFQFSTNTENDFEFLSMHYDRSVDSLVFFYLDKPNPVLPLPKPGETPKLDVYYNRILYYKTGNDIFAEDDIYLDTLTTTRYPTLPGEKVAVFVCVK